MEAPQEPRLFSVAAVRDPYLAKFDFSSFHGFQSNYFITVSSVGLLFTKIHCLRTDRHWLCNFMQSSLYWIQVKAGNESVRLFSVLSWQATPQGRSITQLDDVTRIKFNSHSLNVCSLSCGIICTNFFCFYSGGLRLKYRPRHWRSWSSFFFSFSFPLFFNPLEPEFHI